MNTINKTILNILVIVIAGIIMGYVDPGQNLIGSSGDRGYQPTRVTIPEPIFIATCVPTTEDSPSLDTQYVSGIEVTTTLDNIGTLHVSGVANTVTVANTNIEKIYISGVDNIVYIPALSAPHISQSGIDCVVKKY